MFSSTNMLSHFHASVFCTISLLASCAGDAPTGDAGSAPGDSTQRAPAPDASGDVSAGLADFYRWQAKDGGRDLLVAEALLERLTASLGQSIAPGLETELLIAIANLAGALGDDALEEEALSGVVESAAAPGTHDLAWWRLASLRLAAVRTSPGVSAAARAKEAYGAAFGCIRERIKQDYGLCSSPALDRLTALGSQAEKLVELNVYEPDELGRELWRSLLVVRDWEAACGVAKEVAASSFGPHSLRLERDVLVTRRLDPSIRLDDFIREATEAIARGASPDLVTLELIRRLPSEGSGVLGPDAHVAAGAWLRAHGTAGPNLLLLSWHWRMSQLASRDEAALQELASADLGGLLDPPTWAADSFAGLFRELSSRNVLITLAAQRLLGDHEGESEGVLYALAARGRSDDNPASISSEVDELIDLTGVRGAASVR